MIWWTTASDLGQILRKKLSDLLQYFVLNPCKFLTTNTDLNRKLNSILHGTASSPPVLFEIDLLVWDLVLSPPPPNHGKQ